MKTTKSIRMDESLVNAITARAEKERRTFHSMTLCLLEDAIGKKIDFGLYTTDISAEDMNKDVVTTKPKKKVARFIKPTVDDVRGYCQEKGYTFDPEAWMAHYEANGWKVGRNSMRSWRAACTTWSKQKGRNNGQQSKSAYQQRVEAGDERSFNIDTDF